MRIIRARLKPFGGSAEFLSVRNRIKSLIERNRGDIFNFVIDDGGSKSSKEFGPDNINAELVGKRIPIVDDHYYAQFNGDGTIDVVTESNESNIELTNTDLDDKMKDIYYILDGFCMDREIDIIDVYSADGIGISVDIRTRKPFYGPHGVQMSYGDNGENDIKNYILELYDYLKNEGYSMQVMDPYNGDIIVDHLDDPNDVEYNKPLVNLHIGIKPSDITEGALPRQQTVDQLKRVMKQSAKTDIGNRISDMNKQGANIAYIRNPIDTGIESYEDYMKHNKKFIPSWNLKHLTSPFRDTKKKKSK